MTSPETALNGEPMMLIPDAAATPRIAPMLRRDHVIQWVV